MRYILSIALILAALPVLLFGLAGVQGRISRVPPIEVFPDMDRQAKLRPQEPNPFFANGVSSQLPPTGTVARSEPLQTTAGAVYRFEDSPVNTGRETGTTNFVALNPLPVDEHLLLRGREASIFIAHRVMAGWAMATALPKNWASCPPWPICMINASWPWPTVKFSTPLPTAKV